jgi:hypothetical protein
MSEEQSSSEMSAVFIAAYADFVLYVVWSPTLTHSARAQAMSHTAHSMPLYPQMPMKEPFGTSVRMYLIEAIEGVMGMRRKQLNGFR